MKPSSQAVPHIVQRQWLIGHSRHHQTAIDFAERHQDRQHLLHIQLIRQQQRECRQVRSHQLSLMLGVLKLRILLYQCEQPTQQLALIKHLVKRDCLVAEPVDNLAAMLDQQILDLRVLGLQKRGHYLGALRRQEGGREYGQAFDPGLHGFDFDLHFLIVDQLAQLFVEMFVGGLRAYFRADKGKFAGDAAPHFPVEILAQTERPFERFAHELSSWHHFRHYPNQLSSYDAAAVRLRDVGEREEQALELSVSSRGREGLHNQP